MPELPEVETVLQALKPHLLHERFVEIHTHVPKLRSPLVIADVKELLNSPIVSLTRRAKYIILKLANDYGLLIHLGMTGSWRLEPSAIQRQKHDHAEFLLSSGVILRYHDPRRFGQLILLEPDLSLSGHPLLKDLAPEPLSPEFDEKWLKKVCHGKKKPIKSLIMDNALVVGVGNIYASEALFRAGISPLKPAGKLTNSKIRLLTQTIKDVLQESIIAGGTTIKDYAQPNGEEGNFSRELKVYGKAGQRCQTCHRGIIRQITQSGRSTYYCPVCQQ